MSEILSDGERNSVYQRAAAEHSHNEDRPWPDGHIHGLRAVERAVLSRLAAMGGELPEPAHVMHMMDGEKRSLFTADQLRSEHASGVAAGMALSRRWIPVGERMPGASETVLATYVNAAGRRRRIRAAWVPAKTQEASSEDAEACVEYDEATETYYTVEGWYEAIDNWGDYSSVAVTEGAVDYWQPLSPAPDEKEQT